MYTYDDIKSIGNRFRKFLFTFCIITVIFIALIILTCRNWGSTLDPIRLPIWPLYIAGVFYAVYAVFSWSMIGVRLLRYREFSKDMCSGLEHTVEGKITSVDDNIFYDKDLEFYSISVNNGSDEEDRLLHLDATKDIEQFEVGKDVKLKISGNYIKDVLS